MSELIKNVSFFLGDGTNRVYFDGESPSRLGARISGLGRVPARRSEVPTRSGSVSVSGMLDSKHRRQKAEAHSTDYPLTTTTTTTKTKTKQKQKQK